MTLEELQQQVDKDFKLDDTELDAESIKIQQYTHFRINCYETGGFMKEHIDNIHHSHGQKETMTTIGKQNQQTYKQKKSLNISQIWL